MGGACSIPVVVNHRVGPDSYDLSGKCFSTTPILLLTTTILLLRTPIL
jgi:hypothetical protein